MIRQNRMIIQQMDNEATVDIETENLKMLCDIGERYGVSQNIRSAVAIAVSPLLIIALIKIVFIMNGHHMVLNR